MNAYEKALKVHKQSKKRDFCIQNGICPDCGSVLNMSRSRHSDMRMYGMS